MRLTRLLAHPAALLVATTLAAAGCSRPTPGASPLAERLRQLRRSVAGANAAEPPTRVELRVADPAGRPHGDPTRRPPIGYDTTLWPTHVIPITSTVAPPQTVWVGDRIALVAPPAPDGTPAAMAADLRWSSDEPRVARVERDGGVIALAPGDAAIRAWRVVGETVVPLRVLPAVRGRVVAADGGALRARLVVRSRDGADTVTTDAAGTFAFRPSQGLRGPLSVTVAALDRADDYAAARLDGAAPADVGDLAVVLLPARWTVRGGRYDGETVPIAPAVVQTEARGSHFWRVAGTVGEGAVAHPAVGWPVDHLPVRLAFDRDARVSAADSATFWRIARQLEQDWGVRLFTPATLAPDDSLGLGLVVVTVDPRIRAEGLTTTGWGGSGDVTESMIALHTRALLGDPAVVTHELLHALGIGHAGSGWSSVMHPQTDVGADGRASREDVAYGQLLYAVRARTQAATGRVPVGIAEAAAAASGVP